jgi:hypothetical protein
MKLSLSRLIRNSTVLTDAEEKQKEGRNYLVSAFFGAIFVAVVLAIWPDTLPFSFFQLWKTSGSVGDWLRAAIPIFIWGAGFTAVVSILTRNKPEENRNAEFNFGKGFLLSLWAGVMEEICFRWLIFMSSIIGVKIVNFLIFGFLGLGIPELLQVYILGPIANFFTLGLLADVLVRPEAWAVGAGLLSANGFFRDGHKYLGIIGYVNSWFIGMFMFYLLFTYGLLACIVVHFLYDLAIFAVRFIDQVIERARGNS